MEGKVTFLRKPLLGVDAVLEELGLPPDTVYSPDGMEGEKKSREQLRRARYYKKQREDLGTGIESKNKQSAKDREKLEWIKKLIEEKRR